MLCNGLRSERGWRAGKEALPMQVWGDCQTCMAAAAGCMRMCFHTFLSLLALGF